MSIICSSACFFKTLNSGIGNILPLLCNLERKSGIRRAELDGEVFFIYLLSEENNSAVTSRKMAATHLLSATLHQSVKPLIVNGIEETLIIEHYVMESAGDAFKIDDQIPAIIQQLEENKQAITDDMKL